MGRTYYVLTKGMILSAIYLLHNIQDAMKEPSCQLHTSKLLCTFCPNFQERKAILTLGHAEPSSDCGAEVVFL